VHRIPEKGRPDNIFTWNNAVIVVSHAPDALLIMRFDIEEESFTTLRRIEYPYGDTRYDSGNVSFYARGQYGDALFDITRGAVDEGGRLWITDYLAGKLYILEER
jgi:hypothetical protein